MKKPKPRYKTEQQILDKINREKERNNVYLARAEILEDEIKTMKADAARTGRSTMLPLVLDHKCEIDRLRRICKSIIENRLPKLKNKLSEFRTPQFAALDNGDPSIPVA
jgi:hypothetical protein